MLLGILMAGTPRRWRWAANGLDPKVLSDRQELGPQLGHRTLQPLARRDGTRARVQGLRRRLRRGPDARDLGLAAEAALAARASIPLGELARNLYSLHSAGGSGKLDFSSIVKLARED